MPASPTQPIVVLFSAVAAHQNGDADGLAVILKDSGPIAAEVACAGVLTAAEYLRPIAETRHLAPAALAALLLRSLEDMTGGPRRTAESRVLAAVAANLNGDTDPGRWLPGIIDETVAVVRVTAATLAWHARDHGVNPRAIVEAVLIGAAARSCVP